MLKKFNKNLLEIKNNKDFFEKDLNKNIYFYGKKYLIALNLINFSINAKVKPYDLSKTLNNILKTKLPLFPINGELLKQKGMKEGKSLGNALKELEKEWVNNNFKISNNRIDEIIKIYLN